METQPKISIITVTRNRASFISKAIKSAQNQSFTDWELIVLDDDSNDDTEEIVASFRDSDERIRYYKNSPLLGLTQNRNRGLSLATGKYISVLDSDDFWLDTDKLQKQYDFLEQNPDYVLTGSNIRIVDEHNNLIKETTFATEDKEIRKKILINNQITHSSVLIRKKEMDEINGYNNLPCVEDLDLFLRLGKLGKFKNLKECTTAYTRHSNATSQKRKITMAWTHFKIVIRNFGKYPNWLPALFWAKLRLIKSLF